MAAGVPPDPAMLNSLPALVILLLVSPPFHKYGYVFAQNRQASTRQTRVSAPLLDLAAGAQTLPASETQAPDTYKISVNVDLVVLQATVRDRKGAPSRFIVRAERVS